MTLGLGINTGSYYGSGRTSTAGGYNNRAASSTNISRISRDLASGYSQKIKVIERYLEKGETDQALKMYDELLDSARETASDYGYSLTDDQVASALDNAFQKQTGVDLETTLEEHTSNPFVTGLKAGIPIVGWFTNGTSEAEAYAKITGTEVSAKDRFAEGAGAVVSGAACGAAIGTAIPVIGTAIGAVVGAGLGLLKSIVK